MKLALATCDSLPELDEDDAPLLPALERAGITPIAWVWDRPAPSEMRACVIRSTWDYTFRREEFLAWAERVRVPLWNPPRVLRWNSHKRYLAELAARGADVVPTHIFAAGEAIALDSPTEIVVKPCVSAGARDTFRLRPGDARPALDPAREWMVQPYQPAVEREGEHSLIFLDGEFSHAVRKHPALADTRDARGSEPLIVADNDELACARRVLALVEPLLYARVDLVRGEDGRVRLMELEVFEPSLFFRACPEAAERMARAIVKRMA
jgi:glutathione synthase/RimK-type ligase-like ATP-grasp enzyme